MALEINGKVIEILTLQTGETPNGTWKKQQFIVETLGEYPKKICFQVWGDKTEIVSNLKDGDRVKVNFRLESREYNEKWYTDAAAWKIEKLITNGTTQQAQPENLMQKLYYQKKNQNTKADDLPF